VGPGGDDQVPVADIVLPGGAADTVVDITDSLKFTARATDNVRVATVQVRLRGFLPFVLDTVLLDSTISGINTDVSKAFAVPLPASSAGQRIAITLAVVDGSQNAASDSVVVHVEDPQPPVLTVKEPSAGVLVAAGATLDVVAKSVDPSGTRQMGARLFKIRDALGKPVTITGDSTTYTVFVTTKTDTFSIVVPDTLNPGTYTVHAFTVDNSPNQNDTVSADIAIQVVDAVVPTGTFVNPPQDSQIVAGDNVRVVFRAQDRAGVDSVVLRGFQLRGDSSLGTNQEILRFQPKTAVFPTADDDTIFTRLLLAVPTDSTPSDSVFLEARVFDVGGNVATVLRRVRIVRGPFALVSSPANAARVPVGVPLPITVIARDPDSVRIIGYIASGVAPGADTTTVIAAPLQVEDTVTLNLTVPANATLGPDTITPFGRDRLGNRVLGTPIVVTFQDTVAPTVTISQPSVANYPVTVGDSVLVRVRVQDNRGVSTVNLTGLAHRGLDTLGTGTDVTRYALKTVTLPQRTDTTFSRYLLAVTGDSTSELVRVIVEAIDSSGNRGLDTATVNVVSGPSVSILQPTANAVTSPGKAVVVQVRGVDPQGVRVLGWRASGVVTLQDSVILSPVGGALADTVTFTDTLVVPAATALGNFTITPFGVDSVNAPSGTVGGIVVAVQSAAGDATPPLVTFTLAARVEVDDSVTLLATDASGIQRVGFIVRALGSTAVVRGDSVTVSPSNQTNVTRAFQLSLDTISTFPRQVTIEGFAIDSVGNRGVSSFTLTPKASPADAETLTVVAGKTIALPGGGAIGDAIYNRNRNELYLTNTTLNRLEIFQLTDSTFAPAIPIGSRPVGIALWPRDTLGTNADSVIVANSGGTNLSIVDVSAARVERPRHRLPNYLVQTVTTATNAGGGLDIIVTEYDLSDRPQFVGAACRRGATTACDSVLAVYSTTPTPAQPTPFTNRGYMAWENLRSPAGAPSGHFFYELGLAASAAGTDTLQIIAVRDTAPGQARRDTIVGASAGLIVGLTELAFQDSTFIRNSGDFNHALIGEGGLDQGFARALTFDARSGVSTLTGTSCASFVGSRFKCTAVVDRGVSEGIFLRDFLVNRASRVLSIATNFNGRTNLVRADSIYAFDFTLRQTGLMDVGGANPGMDFPRENTFDAATRGTGGFGGSLNPNDRLVFAARPDANIDVFDTYFYGRVATIPIRDPIIGPVRVATNGSGQRILVGVTATGIVVLRLPAVTNLFPIRQQPVVGSSSR
jgi:hypothetical protein